jgi:hypothetical protein
MTLLKSKLPLRLFFFVIAVAALLIDCRASLRFARNDGFFFQAKLLRIWPIYSDITIFKLSIGFF